MSENFLQQLSVLPDYLAGHLRVSLVALAVGAGVSLPVAVLLSRVRTLRYPMMTAAGTIQTIPSLAMLALMYPLWGTLGFWPAVSGLLLYSLLPMLRNAVTGIVEVDPAMTEAARGVGMTPWQTLFRVELPLALPVIIAGVRTSTVWVVGIATLATPIGQTCLGNYIFGGLQTRNTTAVLFGCGAATALAILLDALIGGLEKGTRERRRGLVTACGIALVAILAGGVVAPDAVSWAQRIGQAEDRFVEPDRPAVVVGAKTFTEQYILATLIDDKLDEAGIRTERKESLGSTVIFDALASGDIDVYVDYTGTIWANHMKREKAAPSGVVLREVTDWLEEEHGIRCLGALGFENAYGLAMRQSQADELGVRTIADLAPHAGDMQVAGDYEFFSRPEWQSIARLYDLAFAEQVQMDSTFMYQAVAEGDVDVISAFTSDGRIAAFDLTVLEDPKDAIPPYDAILLLSESAAQRPDIVDALRPLVGAIGVQSMRKANLQADREDDKKTPQEAAAWLGEQIEAFD